MPGDARPPFPPGGGPHHQPNPGGRPKKTPEMREAEELARASSPDMVRRLIAIAEGCEDPHAVIKAANAVLDRALGKPVQSITGPDGAPLLDTTGDTARLLLAQALARLAPPAIEAEVTVHEERAALPAKDSGK